MSDMLVRLYAMPDHSPLVADLQRQGLEIRRAMVPEKHLVVEWVRQTFGDGWASETEKGMFNTPVSTFVAAENGAMVGFACYDATYRGYFGPTGVAEATRGRGVGKALLWVALRAMYDADYGYAIIGGVGPREFYAKAVGAQVIPESTPGRYAGMLRRQPDQGE